MKKIFSLILSLSFILSGVFSLRTFANENLLEAEYQDHEIYEETEDNNGEENIEVNKHTFEEFVQIILNDQNIPEEKKMELILEINIKERSRISYDYWTIYATCKVTDEYKCRPYFYTYSSFLSGGYPNSIEQVLYANIDRNCNGISKQFAGTLYYKLEAANKLYWDLNGDFYNNGSTTIGGGASIGIGESSSINLQVSYSSNHYAYCHESGRITF